PGRQRIGGSHVLKFCEQGSESWGQNRARIDWEDMGAFRKEIPEGAGHGVAKCPLGAISVGEGFGGVLFDGAVPGNPAETRECFAKNLFLLLHLFGKVDVLVMAAAADPKVRTGRRGAVWRWLFYFAKCGVNKFLLTR